MDSYARWLADRRMGITLDGKPDNCRQCSGRCHGHPHSFATYLFPDSGVPSTHNDWSPWSPLHRIGPFGYHMVKPIRRFTYQADTETLTPHVLHLG